MPALAREATSTSTLKGPCPWITGGKQVHESLATTSFHKPNSWTAKTLPYGVIHLLEILLQDRISCVRDEDGGFSDLDLSFLLLVRNPCFLRAWLVVYSSSVSWLYSLSRLGGCGIVLVSRHFNTSSLWLEPPFSLEVFQHSLGFHSLVCSVSWPGQ